MGIPTPHLLFPLGVWRFLRSFAFPPSCKARSGAESLPCVFPRTVPWNAQVCVLCPSPTESNQLSLPELSCAHHLQGHAWRAVLRRVMRCMERSSCLWASCRGVHRWDILSHSWMSCLIESTEQLVRPMASLLFPASSNYLAMSSTSVSWVEQERSGPIGSILHGWENQTLIHHIFILPWVRNHGPSGVYLGTELCHIRRKGDMGQVKMSFAPPSMNLFLDFLLQCELGLLHWLIYSCQGPLIPECLSKLMLLQGDKVESSYPTTLLMLLSLGIKNLLTILVIKTKLIYILQPFAFYSGEELTV